MILGKFSSKGGGKLWLDDEFKKDINKDINILYQGGINKNEKALVNFYCRCHGGYVNFQRLC